MLQLIRKTDSLAILTPYAAQKNVILQVLVNNLRMDRVKVLTINESQGKQVEEATV